MVISSSSVSSSLPTLIVSTPMLVFTGVVAWEPCFLIFTLAQRNADTPVSLTTDAPEYFQLASDTCPNFAPSLTLTPSESGTYVHVRYAPGRAGIQLAQLTIQTPYATQTVALREQRTQLTHLPRIVPVEAGTRLLALLPSANLSRRYRLAGFLALILVGALSLAGYVYYRQMAPGPFLPEPTPSSTRAPSPLQPETRVKITTIPQVPETAVLGEGTSSRRKGSEQESDLDSERREAKRLAQARKAADSEELFGYEPSVRRTQERPNGTTQTAMQPRQRGTSGTMPLASEESELEQELNRKNNR